MTSVGACCRQGLVGFGTHQLAYHRAVWPELSVTSICEPPCSSKAATTSLCPLWAACWSGVQPSTSRLFTSTLRANSQVTIHILPMVHAVLKGGGWRTIILGSRSSLRYACGETTCDGVAYLELTVVQRGPSPFRIRQLEVQIPACHRVSLSIVQLTPYNRPIYLANEIFRFAATVLHEICFGSGVETSGVVGR